MTELLVTTKRIGFLDIGVKIYRAVQLMWYDFIIRKRSAKCHFRDLAFLLLRGISSCSGKSTAKLYNTILIK